MNIVRPTFTWLAALALLFVVTGLGLTLLAPLQDVVPRWGLIEDVAVLLLWLYAARQAVNRAAATSQPTLWKSLAATVCGIAVILAWGSFGRALESTAPMSLGLGLLLAACVAAGWCHFKLLLDQVRDFKKQSRASAGQN